MTPANAYREQTILTAEEGIKKQNKGKDERKRGKEEGEGKTEKGKKQEGGRLTAQ